MTYLRSLLLNFLTVFFVNHVMPGIEVGSFQNAPNIGADLLFSFFLAFLNSSIFPAFVVFGLKPGLLKMAVLAFAFSFSAFILTATAEIGVKALSWGGVIGATLVVFSVAAFSNFLEYKHAFKPKS